MCVVGACEPPEVAEAVLHCDLRDGCVARIVLLQHLVYPNQTALENILAGRHLQLVPERPLQFANAGCSATANLANLNRLLQMCLNIFSGAFDDPALFTRRIAA